MNALPKLQPITVAVLRKPRWRSYEFVRENNRIAWMTANMDLLMQYYRATSDVLRADGDWTPPDDPEAEFAVWCDITYESEYARFEELKNDREEDVDALDLGTNYEDC